MSVATLQYNDDNFAFGCILQLIIIIDVMNTITGVMSMEAMEEMNREDN